MGAKTTIEWTHHTFNPWRGCSEVHTGCKHCYAKALGNRQPEVFGVWGDSGTRVVASEAMWREPLKWDREAREAGERRRVFCASLADVFEYRPELEAPRRRLFDLIERTPHLDWLLLTKRPESAPALLQYYGRERFVNGHRVNGWMPGGCHFSGGCCGVCNGAKRNHSYPSGCPNCDGTGHVHNWQEVPRNIWIGTSISDQRTADELVPQLLRVPAAVRFLSVEPLLGPVDLTRWLPGATAPRSASGDSAEPIPSRGTATGAEGLNWVIVGGELNWVIVGGESGTNARPCDVAWIRSIVQQCAAASVPCFVKQLGARPTLNGNEIDEGYDEAGWRIAPMRRLRDPKTGETIDVSAKGKGGDMNEWPEDLRVRQFPVTA